MRAWRQPRRAAQSSRLSWRPATGRLASGCAGRGVAHDPAFYQRCNSFFVCGSPNGTQAGTEGFGFDLARARKLLAEAGL